MEETTIEKMDIVMVGLVAWDFALGNNCKNIAIEFAKHHSVLFVNPPLDRNTILKKKEKAAIARVSDIRSGKQNAIEKISDSLWVFTPSTTLESINWIPVAFLHALLNKVNNRRYASEIDRAVKELGFKNILLFNDNDIFRSFYLKEYLHPSAYVYYIRDNLTAIGYWRKHGLRLESKLIAKSDAVLANSTYLSSYAGDYNKNAYYVGQGCELGLFDEKIRHEEPQDLSAIKHPRIGYVGNLTSLRLDIPLLIYIARTRPDWNIVLVGPEDEAFLSSELHGISNVYFPGPKKMEALPAYIAYFDVCINPQSLNPLTIGNYPRKIDEYLAMGKPVVATKTKAMEAFGEHTYLAEKNKDYISLIEKALTDTGEDTAKSRRRFAGMHTWENNVKEIYKAFVSSSLASEKFNA
jgi:glycosyltransferase involved in cell wall biosynthesis